MRKDRLGKQASIIGQITPENKGLVVLETLAGGERLVEMLSGEPIPRIC
jgi:hydrogenase expression/formation protein HypE